METRTLDARGLNCPMPILKTKQTLAQMNDGEVLEVLATDPGSVEDFRAFCRATGNQLISDSEAGGTFTYRIERQG
ncbi:sulfurtransferase TusA family protein [Parerythrobacter aestuarii]|uniref:sulfurtransferase TusA family protein n=1 Tax=Parerythrobacter aestuarii TaxID=3020909 RepID=UPI0024DE8B13|nr:sulfurtransferase TusA family protein [Parerythrobacter aestuarii]